MHYVHTPAFATDPCLPPILYEYDAVGTTTNDSQVRDMYHVIKMITTIRLALISEKNCGSFLNLSTVLNISRPQMK
jgi:hypothetical protein